MIDEGDLPAYKIGRVLRLRRHEVDAFIESCRVKPGDLTHLLPRRDDGDQRRPSAEGPRETRGSRLSYGELGTDDGVRGSPYSSSGN